MQPRSQGLSRPQASVNKLRMPVFLPLVKIRLLLRVRWLITDTANRNVMYKVLYEKAPPKCPTPYTFWQKRYQGKASGDKRVEDEISMNVANLFLK